MYRLEQVASRLMEKVLEEVKLEYISAKTLSVSMKCWFSLKPGLNSMVW
jgi:hypothetical protein